MVKIGKHSVVIMKKDEFTLFGLDWRRLAMLAVPFVLVIVVACLGFSERRLSEKCEARGGVLARAAWEFVCVQPVTNTGNETSSNN